MNYYSIGEFAKLIGKTEQTLRNWDKNNTLKPHHIEYVVEERVNGRAVSNKDQAK